MPLLASPSAGVLKAGCTEGSSLWRSGEWLLTALLKLSAARSGAAHSYVKLAAARVQGTLVLLSFSLCQHTLTTFVCVHFQLWLQSHMPTMPVVRAAVLSALYTLCSAANRCCSQSGNAGPPQSFCPTRQERPSKPGAHHAVTGS